MASKLLNIMQIKRAVREACEADDVSLMSQIVSTVSEPGSVATLQEVLNIGLDRSTAENATKILSCVLQEGADVQRRGAHLTLNWGTFHLPTLETIDVLIAHGWDINSHGTHGTYSEPLLWNVLDDPEPTMASQWMSILPMWHPRDVPHTRQAWKWCAISSTWSDWTLTCFQLGLAARVALHFAALRVIRRAMPPS